MIKIIRNALRCKNCGDIIESKHLHDFVQCRCGDCSVDGGHCYLKGSFNPDGKGFEDLSEVIEIPEESNN